MSDACPRRAAHLPRRARRRTATPRYAGIELLRRARGVVDDDYVAMFLIALARTEADLIRSRVVVVAAPHDPLVGREVNRSRGGVHLEPRLGEVGGVIEHVGAHAGAVG